MGSTSPEADPFERQRRITWWRQDALASARIMVVGAGAIGNEVLKNLALLGAGYLFVADFDSIEDSNLSRTVLFRASDVGCSKARVAATRTQNLCVHKHARVDWFNGDVVWEIGLGVIQRFDVVLACVDNVETRLWINRQCRLTGRPWIDAGIDELGVRVNAYLPTNVPCYECALSADQRNAARQRYSCDDFKRRFVEQGTIPTVQIAAALAAALQVQEAVKLLCGQPVLSGHRINYQGLTHDFAVIPLLPRASCVAHVSLPPARRLPFGNNVTLGGFLQAVSSASLAGPEAALVLSDRFFASNGTCSVCGSVVELNRPNFLIYADELLCPECSKRAESAAALPALDTLRFSTFTLETTPAQLLDAKLSELGIPRLHILSVRDKAGHELYFELSGDEHFVLPQLSPCST